MALKRDGHNRPMGWNGFLPDLVSPAWSSVDPAKLSLSPVKAPRVDDTDIFATGNLGLG